AGASSGRAARWCNTVTVSADHIGRPARRRDRGAMVRSMAPRTATTSAKAPTRTTEQELWAQGHEVVVGIDEVGRGAWAGPLMVGAAILPRTRRVLGV